jgi:CheY-like chemotaxis protein
MRGRVVSRYIVFFDDYPLESENQIFLFQLRRAFRDSDLEIVDEKTIPRLETRLRTRQCAAIILDIMAALPDAPDMDALAGIEVLRRCREGNYGEMNRDAPVFMRTARAEPHVKQMAVRHQAAGYFLAGSDDEQLIEALRERLLES